MQYSHSRVECHISCPYKYKLRYVDHMKLIPAFEPDDVFICGNTIHLGAETDLKTAIDWYYSNYPIITNEHINEIIKFEYLIPKIHELLTELNVYKKEFKISTPRFVGIIDLIIKNEDGTVDVFDYKYSNNIEHYAKSPQLHLYKYYLEQIGFKVKNLGFIFIPKISIKQKNTETLYQFRKRLMDELKSHHIRAMPIQFDKGKVIEFLNGIIDIKEDEEYQRNPSTLCDWCDYKKLCLEENDVDMLLPSVERRDITKIKKKKIWIYGPAFCGKTTMLDEAPNPLNLNTDGNIQFVTMPYIPIKDEITYEGRLAHKKFAWTVFKDIIVELEKKENDFKTIIVDLIEDTREMCRLYKYDELNITHESDSGYGKGWDIIKTEYLSTIRRLFNLDYENIVVISHEDVSKDITKKNGQNITRIGPNIQDAIANKIAGMVDIVARVVVDDDGTRTLNFKSDEVIFGGGRLKGITKTKIPLSWEELMKVYDEANKGKADKKADEPEAEKPKESKRSRKTPEKVNEDEKQEVEVKNSVPEEIEKAEDVSEETQSEEEKSQEEAKEEAPVEKPRRTRRGKRE